MLLKDLTPRSVRELPKTQLDERRCGVRIRLEVKDVIVHGGDEQVVAVDVRSTEHSPLAQLANARQEFEYGFDQIGCCAHGKCDAQR